MAKTLTAELIRMKERLYEDGVPEPYRMFVTSSHAAALEREFDGRTFPVDPDWEQPPDIEVHGQQMTWCLSVYGVDVYCPKPPPVSATCVEVDGTRGVIAFAWNG